VVVQTGQLASEVGGELMETFRRFQAFLEGPDGAFSKNLTTAQRSFIETELGALTRVQTDITAVVGRNGMAQSQVETVRASLDDRAISLKTLLATRTEVDLAQAVSELKQAQISVEATARVYSTLKSSSLLDLLR
jgi:flagellar hook-associated protein 3 FlgL